MLEEVALCMTIRDTGRIDSAFGNLTYDPMMILFTYIYIKSTDTSRFILSNTNTTTLT